MRRRRMQLLTLVAVTATLLAGCAGDSDDVEDLEAGFEDLDDDSGDGEPLDADRDDGQATDDEAADGDDGLTVEILDNLFVPEVLEVSVGDTVTWTHEGSANHTVTARDFDSGELSTGEVFAVTFDEAGTVPYACTIHQGMAGEIIVVE